MLAEEGDDLSKVEVPKSSGAPKAAAAAAPTKEEKKETPGEHFLQTDDFGAIQKFGSNGTEEHNGTGQLEWKEVVVE